MGTKEARRTLSIRHKIVRITLDIVLILLITLVLLVVTELLLRLIYPRDDFKSERISYQYDSLLLIRLKSGIERTYVRDAVDGNDTIHWNITEEGFRGKPLKKEKRRIMVFGDSNVQGVFSADDKTFCARLESWLTTLTGKEVEVVNAGTVGFGTDQCLLRFSRDAVMYHPDDVVFVVFGHNDYGDIIRNRLFELDDHDSLVITRYNRHLDPLLQKPGWFTNIRIMDLVRKFRKKAGLNRQPDHKEVVDLTIQQYRNLCDQQFQNYLEHGPNIYSHFFDNYDMDVAAFPDSHAARVKVLLMEGVLKLAQEEAVRQNANLVLVILPSAIDITTNRSINRHDLERFPGYKPTNLTDPLEHIAVKYHIPYLNLYPVYSGYYPNTLYFSGTFNDHWTDLGQEIAAEHTAELLLSIWKSQERSMP